MLKFYYHPSPNPAKVALFLEEADPEYELVPSTREGRAARARLPCHQSERHDAVTRRWRRDCLRFRPPFCSIAEKTGRFLPENTPRARGELLSWLFFVSSGVGPFSGHAFHFNAIAPEKIEYAIKRYNFEARRHWRSSTTGWPGGDHTWRRLHDRRHVGVGLGSRRRRPSRP